MINRRFILAVAFALISVPALLLAIPNASSLWRAETTSDGSSITKRHETGSVVVDGNLYVLGGRRRLPVEVYRPSTDGWESLGLGPIEMHHFQPVAIGSKIYAIGAMTCCFPNEPTIADIHVFNTANSNWSIEGQIPENRRRGGAGSVVYNNKFILWVVTQWATTAALLVGSMNTTQAQASGLNWPTRRLRVITFKLLLLTTS